MTMIWKVMHSLTWKGIKFLKNWSPRSVKNSKKS
ncbi:hypothetical protein LINPERHAP1_LOCUS133 [Linum perenne]